ncbi:hypothetical protein ADK76_19560 [Streptomyces griseoflavus]|uniref:hypothetical protein n=1 Tax=Streptomyces rimosus TaxID=1927 RepID=UPI0004C5788B|nr:hypothetical protein [Streptomyces rimosus]KOG56501.1 hypothetical protein ADK76_19560 [Streptomyces griseoflavus]KWT62321.1 hypothetical protein ADL21_08665 [Streptomyces albus subsp. albus]
MAGIDETLRDLVQLKGVLGASVVDYFSRLTLGAVGDPAGPDLETAARGDTDVVRAKLFTLELLGYRPERVQDILITLDDELHLIRPLTRRSRQGIFVYLVLDRASGDLDTARDRLRQVESELDV